MSRGARSGVGTFPLVAFPTMLARAAAASLLALLLAAPASTQPARPRAGTKGSTIARDAKVFVETMGTLLQPVSRVAAESAWPSVTDVSPEHTGERAGAEKAAAAV